MASASTARRLVALDVDGTTIDHDGVMSDVVRSAVRDVAEAGHHVVVATGRAIVATLPVLDRLGLTEGWAVCSNGAVTIRLDPALPEGFEIVEAVTFDPRPALELLRDAWPGAVIAVQVADGAEVAAGDVVVIVEAMKMEHSLTAPIDGTVEILAPVGTQVAVDEVLARITPPDAS